MVCFFFVLRLFWKIFFDIPFLESIYNLPIIIYFHNKLFLVDKDTRYILIKIFFFKTVIENFLFNLYFSIVFKIVKFFKVFVSIFFFQFFFSKNLTVFGNFFGPLLMGLFFCQKILKNIPNCRKLNSTSDFQYIKSIILCINGQKGLFIRCKTNLTRRLLFFFCCINTYKRRTK